MVYIPQHHESTPLIQWQFLLSQGDVKIKPYTLFAAGSPKHLQTATLMDRIAQDIHVGDIDKKLGLGFSIISDGTLNVCLWGGEYPSLLNQTLYTFDCNPSGEIVNFRRNNPNNIGAFCCGELGIVAHEAAAWRRYLLSHNSQSKTIRERNYLDDVFKGIVR